MTKKIKLFDPVISSEEKKSLISVLDSKFWASGSGIGYVSKFENEFKKYLKSNSCVAVNSGTAALNLALSLFDIKNKEVILPSLSFVSTAHAVIENAGIPIFVDVDPVTLCISPENIESAITKKTSLILPVHFGGMPCDMSKISKIAKKYNLNIVEDAAHAVGTKFNHKKIGTHGDAVCFSFHPVKNLAMPTGGAISINHKNHKKFSKLLFSRRWCGITDRRETDYDVKEIGWNYYMNEFSAVIGLQQLKKLEKLNKRRIRIAKKYYSELNIKHKMQFNKNCSYHFYWILISNRTKFRKKLSDQGIETGTHYKPIHLMQMYNHGTNLPLTEKIGKQIVTIPIHPNLTNIEIKKIISCINEFS